MQVGVQVLQKLLQGLQSDGQLGIPQVAGFREPGIKANASGQIWDMVTCFSLVTLLSNSSPML